MATTHPVKERGGSPAAVRAFEQVAIGNFPMCHPNTLKWLLDRDLVRQGGDEVVGADRFGPITRRTYFVPMQHHVQWCVWCSEQPGVEV